MGGCLHGTDKQNQCAVIPYALTPALPFLIPAGILLIAGVATHRLLCWILFFTYCLLRCVRLLLIKSFGQAIRQ